MQKIRVLHTVTSAKKTDSKVLPWEAEAVYYVGNERFTAITYSRTKLEAIADAIDKAYRQAIKKAVA